MNKSIFAVVAIIGGVGAISSIIMTVMALRFMELGRVFFYLTLAFLCLGIAAWGIMHLTSKKS